MMQDTRYQSPRFSKYAEQHVQQVDPIGVVKIDDIDRLSHLAWVLLHLVRIGVSLNKEGWCLGATTPTDTNITVKGIKRARSSLMMRPWHAVRGYLHRKWFHDAGCDAVGVSHRLFRRWLQAARKVKGTILIEEAYMVAVEEVIHVAQTRQSAYEAWTQLHGELSPVDFFSLHLRNIIVPESPWNTQESPSVSSRTPKRQRRRQKNR